MLSRTVLVYPHPVLGWTVLIREKNPSDDQFLRLAIACDCCPGTVHRAVASIALAQARYPNEVLKHEVQTCERMLEREILGSGIFWWDLPTDLRAAIWESGSQWPLWTARDFEQLEQFLREKIYS